jgi:hypothetical protein
MNRCAALYKSVVRLFPIKRLLPLLSLWCIGSYGIGQVTTIFPDKFQHHPNENAVIQFYTEEGKNSRPQETSRNSLQQLLHYTPGGKIIDVASNFPDTPVSSIHLTGLGEGTHMIIFHSKNTFKEIDAEIFNAFLKANNCTEALNYRKLHHEDSANARESFQASIKTIFQAGFIKNTGSTQPTTLPIDIFPNKNLYACNQDSVISKLVFTIYFKGKPLTNATVKISHEDKNGVQSPITLQTDKKGRIKTSIRCTGRWKLDTVQMQRLPAENSANWQCYFGSLTWGYN